MKKKKYYGVAGVDGYGVYDDYDSILGAKPFITSVMIKEFGDFNEAKVFAVNTCEGLQDGTSDLYEIKKLDEKNKFYRRELVEGSFGSERDKIDVSTDNNFFETDDRKRKIQPFIIGI